MDSGQLLSVGALVAFFTFMSSSFAQVKSAFMSMQKIWLQPIQLDKFLSSAVYKYCSKTMKSSKFRGRVYNGCMGTKSSDKKEGAFVFDILNQSTLVFWKGFKFIILTPGPWKYDDITATYERTVNLYIPRFFWNSDKFIKTAIEDFNIIKEKRFRITRVHGKNNALNIMLDESKKPDLMLVGAGSLIKEAQAGRANLVGHNLNSIIFDGMGEVKPFDWYAFNPEAMIIVKKTRDWFSRKQWYKEKHISWRIGIEVSGCPGSGKTLFLKCVAEDLDIPIFCFDIGSMTNEELVKFWYEAVVASPCMILLEDFDSVFHGRENIATKENGVSFDCLLNCISGVESTDGVVLAITSNHPEHLDPALTRPGRIDERLVMNNMDENCRRIMATRIFENGEEIEKIVVATKDMTAAAFIKYCNDVLKTI